MLGCPLQRASCPAATSHCPARGPGAGNVASSRPQGGRRVSNPLAGMSGRCYDPKAGATPLASFGQSSSLNHARCAAHSQPPSCLTTLSLPSPTAMMCRSTSACCGMCVTVRLTFACLMVPRSTTVRRGRSPATSSSRRHGTTC